MKNITFLLNNNIRMRTRALRFIFNCCTLKQHTRSYVQNCLLGFISCYYYDYYYYYLDNRTKYC